MQIRSLSLCLVLCLLAGNVLAAPARKAGFTILAKYEGGTLPLNPGRIKATVAEDQVVFQHGSHRLAVPMRNITAVTCNTDVRRRFGATVLGIVPLMHLDKSEVYYIGLTWTGDSGQKSSKAEMVLRLTGAEYRDFLAAIERLAGIRAVNADKVPTVVRYEL
jgi:hypothetical protein